MAISSFADSPSILRVILGTAVVVYIIFSLVKGVYNVFLHPLRKVPGPFLASLTSRWADFQDIASDRCAVTHRLHLKYGSVVRLGPNELSFSDPEAAKNIYSMIANFPKAPVYDTLGNSPFPTLFEMRDRELHRQRRKIMAPSFAKSTMEKAEPEFAAQVNRFFEWLHRKEGVPLNMAMWCRMLALDVTGAVFLGEPLGAMDSDAPHNHAIDLDGLLALSGVKWHLPWAISLFGWIPYRPWQRFIGASDRIYNFGREALSRYVESHGSAGYKPDDPVSRMFSAEEQKGVRLGFDQMGAEVATLLLAGSEPVGTTLGFATWELARHPEWQDILRQELKDAGVSFNSGAFPAWSAIEKLENLNAVFLEGLRLHPSAPGALPRIVPGPEPAVISGVVVPPGTIISSQNFTLHRDAAIFESPQVYCPTRWLSPIGGTTAMKESYRPFSTGARSCIGMHFATMILKMTLAGLVNSWDIKLALSTSKEEVAVTDYFAFMPKIGVCQIIFTRRNVLSAEA